MLLAFLLLFSGVTQASPIPAMASSVFSSQGKALIFNSKGFVLNSGGSKWQWQVQHHDGQELAATFSAPAYLAPLSKGNLQVKVENLEVHQTLESYARKWMKDYPSYGFEVLGSRTFNQNNARGYVIDLFHKAQSRQIRQVVFVKDKTVVTLTCSDYEKGFDGTLANCNSIVKTFRWMN